MLPSQAPGMDEWLQKLGSLPLLEQPGERWMYHVSGDLLGTLIARVVGQSRGGFMRERIFDPLGMKDTAFHVLPKKSTAYLRSISSIVRRTDERARLF
jgi:CubicO group peptidase (beta-lactamase class C family)